MADTFTAILNLTKPEVGASTDTWGTKVNADLDTLDGLFQAGPALKLANGGTGAVTAAGARTNLGLGGDATGTNLSALTNAATARSNLGLAIGTDVQAYSPVLSSYAATGIGFRNRIINGDMRIDQRNNGASVSSGFSVDRFGLAFSAGSKFTAQQNAGAVTPPSGFTYYLGATSSSSYSISASDYFNLYQNIEGFNSADLGWGAAGAQAVTLSFWVRSSLTGTFGGSLRNGSANYSYPFTFAVSAANTWEQKTIVISGPTAGTWNTTNGSGIGLNFGLGVGSTYSGTAGAWAASNFLSATGATSVVGTNGATFYITGVQLEAGTVATPFERRDYGRELMMCQRYYSKSYDIGTAVGTNTSYAQSAVAAQTVTSSGLCQTSKLPFPVVMRVAPTVNLWTYSGTAGSWHAGVAGQSETAYSASANAGFAGTTGVVISMSGVNTTYNTAYGHWAANSEL